MGYFRTTRASGVERTQKTLFSSHRSECTHCTARARRQLLKAAADGPPQDSLVTVRARSRWAGRPAAGRYQASMGRIKIQVRLAAAGIVRLGRPEGNKCLDHGCEPGMGG
jgi:hypothetical protein